MKHPLSFFTDILRCRKPVVSGVLLTVLMGFANIAYGLSCSVSGTDWGSGYIVTVTVVNDEAAATTDWQLQLDFNANPAVTNFWNANVISSGNRLQVSNVAWNGVIWPGQSAVFGLMGTLSGAFTLPLCSAGGASPTPVPTPQPTPTATPTPTPIPTAVPTPTPTPTPGYSSSSSSGGYSSSSNGSSGGGGYSGSSSGGAGYSSSSSGSGYPTPTPSGEPEIDPDETFYYLSYDDSASTAPRDLTFAALSQNRLPEGHLGRTYEFLNAETFEHFAPQEVSPFTVSMGLVEAEPGMIPVSLPYEGRMYALGIHLSGPTLTKAERKNVVLTLLVDTSGSMDGLYARNITGNITTLLGVAKYGMAELTASLKPGDVLNVVTFATNAHVLLTDWAYSPDDDTYVDLVGSLSPNGSTNLNAGIELAYAVANETFDPAKANRVIILTDAYANTGQIDSEIIAEHTVINGLEGILFSGVGVGSGFNDAFLNELTDIGKSTYSAMVTPTDAARIFTSGFMRFVDHAVENIQFRLDYPQSLDQLKSAGEEISGQPSEVSTVNYAYNSSQFFLELFSSDVLVDTAETIKLTATFNNASGGTQVVEVEKSLAALLAENNEQLYTAAAVTTLARLVARELSCSEVRASGLYELTYTNALFTQYITAIDNYCALVVVTPTPTPIPTVIPTWGASSTSSSSTSSSTGSSSSSSGWGGSSSSTSSSGGF